MAWFLYNVVTVGKTAMDIFIDEGWRLLRSGPFADLLDELGRRARKRDIGVTLITHMPQDLVKNPSSLSMASTAFIGRIGPEEAFAFFRSIGIAETEAMAECRSGVSFTSAYLHGRAVRWTWRIVPGSCCHSKELARSLEKTRGDQVGAVGTRP